MKVLNICFTLGVAGVTLCLAMTFYRGAQEKRDRISLRISDLSIPVPAH
jgi:hypothetical protein